MKGYKAFEKGMICRGKQYAENTVFEEECIKICKQGMHYCENPFDVLSYYPLVDENGNVTEFANVEAIGEIQTENNKSCTTKLKIGAKLTLKGFVDACFGFIYEKANATSGDYSQVATSGDDSQVATSGDGSQVATSGYGSRVATSGGHSKVATSGNSSQVATSGDGSQVATSGYSSRVATSGYGSRVATNGNDSRVATSGYGSRVATNGDHSRVATSGRNSVICCIGMDSKACAKKGSWITLSEWKYSDTKQEFVPICVKTEYVDGERIKEDVFYKLENGEFVEVK